MYDQLCPGDWSKPVSHSQTWHGFQIQVLLPISCAQLGKLLNFHVLVWFSIKWHDNKKLTRLLWGWSETNIQSPSSNVRDSMNVMKTDSGCIRPGFEFQLCPSPALGSDYTSRNLSSCLCKIGTITTYLLELLWRCLSCVYQGLGLVADKKTRAPLGSPGLHGPGSLYSSSTVLTGLPEELSFFLIHIT